MSETSASETGIDFVAGSVEEPDLTLDAIDVGIPDEVDFYGIWDDMIAQIIQQERRAEVIEPVQPRKLVAEIEDQDRIVIFEPEYRTEGFGIVGNIVGEDPSKKLILKLDPDTKDISFELIKVHKAA